ncbi:MAG: metallopeptidase family protein [Verrucomicrobiae bacterium]|nr:metallopeptidase family protein [Verrucomicrobiae bacterium]MCP5516174.1 metallopeptidase family protein [Verrucomicrobiales bacterium]MCP5528600.1 metallopeptidase family protein [Verrucomicrobiales bacterium]
MQLPDLLKLQGIAESVVTRTVRALPAELRRHAETLPVCFEPAPNAETVADGIDPDTLGLFVGPEYGEAESALIDVPSQIILYLENLWDFSEGDEDLFRGEVRTTFLHELGHYLGLDEDDLERRGLL